MYKQPSPPRRLIEKYIHPAALGIIKRNLNVMEFLLRARARFIIKIVCKLFCEMLEEQFNLLSPLPVILMSAVFANWNMQFSAVGRENNLHQTAALDYYHVCEVRSIFKS